MRPILPALLASAALFGLATMAPAPVSAQDSIDDLMLRMSGEFELRGNETKTVVSVNSEKHYRICLGKAGANVGAKTRDVGLIVNHDGRELLVTPGSCADVEAKTIQLKAAGKLGDDDTLIGRYQHLR